MSTDTDRFVILGSSACMPNSCWGSYCRYAVVELEPGFVGLPKMISTHARGLKRIVETWESLNCGGRYSAAGKALAEATDLADDLNGVWGKRAQRTARLIHRLN